VRELDVVHQQALGDLEYQVLRRDARFRDDPIELVGELEITQLAAREVHRNAHLMKLGRRGAPLGELATRRLEDPQADGDDESGLLGELDELGGHQQPPLGVVPADERLELAHPAR
jgi:hypothetical protein